MLVHATNTSGMEARIFDGFDEFPEALQKDGLIADVLKRQVLPNCVLVVSSRPHASVGLRQHLSG